MAAPTNSALEPERRSALLGAKLRGLVAGRWGPDDASVRVTDMFPGGAFLTDPVLGTVWVLAEDDPLRSLGGALARAARVAPEAEVHVIVADRGVAPVVARQAAQFAVAPQVWLAVGVELEPVTAATAHAPGPGPAGVESLTELIVASGAELRLDHGRWVGEWLGLELACIVVDPDFGARLEVGVGRHDREAFGMIHGDRPAPEALASVLTAVQAARRPDRPDGPLARISRETWLRCSLLARPDLVGAAHLEPAESTVARDSVMESAPAIAVGTDPSGAPVVVACSTGIDPNLVPAAADARYAYAPGARLVLAVPERDRNPFTDRLAASLSDPAEVITVPTPWSGA